MPLAKGQKRPAKQSVSLERFAGFLAEDRTQVDSFYAAGGVSKSRIAAKKRACDLAARPDVQEMVARMKADVLESVRAGFKEAVEVTRTILHKPDSTHLDQLGAASLFGKWDGRDGKTTINLGVLVLPGVSMLTNEVFQPEKPAEVESIETPKASLPPGKPGATD